MPYRVTSAVRFKHGDGSQTRQKTRSDLHGMVTQKPGCRPYRRLGSAATELRYALRPSPQTTTAHLSVNRSTHRVAVIPSGRDTHIIRLIAVCKKGKSR